MTAQLPYIAQFSNLTRIFPQFL